MKRRIQILGILCFSLLLGGCMTTGLSMRDHRGENYMTYLSRLYATQIGDPAQRPVLRTPARLAVAQIGEVAPPDELIEFLRKRPEFFTAVIPIPGNIQVDKTVKTDQNVINAMARDFGADYVFVFGGAIDYGTRETAWSVLDVTLVGGYLVPSVEMEGVGRASGVLVDLESDRSLFMVSAEADAEGRTATALRRGAQDQLVNAIKRDVITILAERLVGRMGAQGAGYAYAY